MNEVDSDEPPARLRSLSNLQQRFEESRIGQVVISAIIVLILLIGVVCNLPDSPIKLAVTPVARPLAEGTGLDKNWGLYAPNVSMRLETIQVDVTMADQSHRVWTVRAGERLIGRFAWSRWVILMERVVAEPELRPGISEWVARQVTGPTERAAHVAMILRAQNLPAPGEEASRSIATKVLYEEDLPGRP